VRALVPTGRLAQALGLPELTGLDLLAMFAPPRPPAGWPTGSAVA
jgi:hypothetical protein